MKTTVSFGAALFGAIPAVAQLTAEHRFLYPASVQAMAIIDADSDGDGDAVHLTGNSFLVHEQFAPGQFRVGYELEYPGRVDRMRVVDLDGDGVDDLLMPRRDSSAISWVRVLGGGGFAPMEDLITGLDRPFDVQAADMDGDLDLDLVFAYGTSNVTVAWSANNAGAFGPVIPITSNASVYNEDRRSFFDLGDIDQDGDMDVMTLLPLLDFNWWENIGMGSFFIAHPFSLATYTLDMQLADVNGDNYPDLVYSYQGLHKCINDGAGGFGAAQGVGVQVSALSIDRIDATDTDGDGDIDLLFRITSGSGTPFELARMTNNGSGGFSYAGSWLHADQSQPFVAGDMNGTGSVELLGQANYGLYLVTDMAPSHVRITSAGAPLQITVMDTDGDTDNDVVLSSPVVVSVQNDGFDPAQLVVHRNLGNGVMDQMAQEEWVSASSIHHTTPSDLDGDGDLDLMAVWQNEEATFWYRFMVLQHNGAQFDSLCGFGGQVILLPQPWDIPTLRDLDGDGRADNMRHGNHELIVAHNSGSGIFGTEQAYLVALNDAITDATICEVDGDGSPDFVWKLDFAGLAGNDSVFWSANDGTGVPGPVQFLGIGPSVDFDYNEPRPIVASAELNNDGQEDLVFFNGDSIGVMINTGASSMITTQAWAVNAAAYDLGDMDLDGLTDIIVIRANADIVLYLNQGNGLFGPPLLMAGAPWSTGTSDIALADMDGDGDLDVVTCATDGSAAWLGNTLDFPLGAAEATAPRTVQVRPNPASTSFTIDATEPVQRVDVLDMRGRVLCSESANRTTVVTMDRGRSPTGVYMVRATCISGAIHNARIVIE